MVIKVDFNCPKFSFNCFRELEFSSFLCKYSLFLATISSKNRSCKASPVALSRLSSMFFSFRFKSSKSNLMYSDGFVFHSFSFNLNSSMLVSNLRIRVWNAFSLNSNSFFFFFKSQFSSCNFPVIFLRVKIVRTKFRLDL